MSNEIYEGLYARTGGHFNLNVSGASGTGKSTFIRAFAASVLNSVPEEKEDLCVKGSIRTESGALEIAAEETHDAAQGEKAAAVLVVSDGSFGKARSELLSQEEAIAAKLRECGKPFMVYLNSAAPGSAECEGLRVSLAEKYGAPVLAGDIHAGLDADKFMAEFLMAFPVKRMDFYFPEWMRVLPAESKIVSEILTRIREITPKVERMGDCGKLSDAFGDGDVYCESCETDVSSGVAKCCLAAKDGMFYKVLSEECGVEITDDLKLMAYVRALGEAKTFYDKYGSAFRRAEEYGYGVSVPSESDMKLCSPELFRRGTRSGVKLRAQASTYHVIKVDVQSEVSPIAGEAARGEEIAKGMVDSYEKDPDALWNTDMFGKTFKDMAREGLLEKTVPEDARGKLRKAVTRIVNEGKGGVICILL